MLDENKQEFKKIIEGILMAAQDPLRIEDLAKIINLDEKILENKELKELVQSIHEDYTGRGIELKEVAGGYRFQINSELSPWISRLFAEKPPRYSKAFLETLAIIAYKQPVTRAEIEAVRGVTLSSSIMKTLTEREWIQIVGYKELPGKPALYGTTKKFLDYFNLRTLAELPTVELQQLTNDDDDATETTSSIEEVLAIPTQAAEDEVISAAPEAATTTTQNDETINTETEDDPSQQQ